ncbi:Origin recognition complex, subunit 1 [Linnemannia schmuckeri]|uniref:Origin recognition complex subunit 1 n=1 Tax=Linnemannia schmuckeri TaxID=64567 RepID=A0A9P5RX04_9FUNG|nr:Origin recognition complex, subunit 1 [Linnemannia schmuckeri]
MVTTTQRVNNRLAKAKSQAQKDILYPPSDSDSDDDEPEWVGEPLNKDTLIRRTSSKTTSGGDTPSRKATRGSGLSNIPYYNAFKKGGMTYSIGDIVLLRNEQYSRRFDYPYIAQILSLWETEDGDCEGAFRWFHQDEDIAKLRRHQRTGNFPESLERGEIVYTLDDDKNDINTVIAKGQVLNELQWREKIGEAGTNLTLEERDMTFFCRGMVRKRTGYQPIEWNGNKEMLALKDEKELIRVPTPAKGTNSTKPARETISSVSKQLEGTSSPHRMKRARVQEEHEAEGSDDDVRDQAYSEKVSDQEQETDEEESDESTKAVPKRRQPKKTAGVAPKKRPIKTVAKAPSRSKSLIIKTPTTQRSISATAPKTDFEHARSRLHVKAVPDSLPCREDEFLEIQEHLESAIEDGTGSCIYISGVPGTGKTATVHEVIRSLQAKAEEGEISPFQFVEINGMKVTEPSYAYVLLWMALSEQKVTANHALQLLEKQFSTPGPRRLPCVVLMDELDLLVTSKQTVMYNFFEWPNWLHSRLIVVAVANTMDLPERMLSNKVSSRLGLTRINFQPYTYQQLVKIVESRLEGIQAFRREAIEFAARKVGAVSGDARRALDICRRAVEIVETNAQKAEDQRRLKAERNPFEDLGPAPDPEQVTIRTVDQAIKEMFASPNVRLIQTASLHQKLFLVALTARLRRLGLAEVEFSEIAHAHLQMCRLHNIEPPMLSDLSAICASLGSSRCLLVESGKQDLHQRVRLSVSEEDVIMALKVDPLFRRLLDTLPSAPAT